MAPAEPAAKRAASGDLDAAANGDGMPPVMADGRCNSRALSFSELQSAGANPQRRGLPKRAPSLTKLVDDLVDELKGDKSINSVLVANNGLGAVKFMRSIRSWANQTFGNSRAIALVAMATPEDIRINAEHVTLADQFVEVPGGTNNNNYANVKLIVQVAERAGVDAVWPGWGHASENPELPEALAARGIRFLGPPAAAMAALGDKIGSTILAQAAGVPTLPWSGSGVAISYEDCGGVIPQDTYDQACVFTLDEAIEACAKIGYPVMLKASWGGGGKGIRKVQSDEDVRAVFKQIQGEVPGSPIFAMKLAPLSRHLEVQLIADRHGNVVSLFTRDCSVQRRHQKIVEEGPALAASQEMLRDMERCARALARSVGYQGAATVEYLYSIEEKKYYFLELNPRLQVEHPVTEGITNVNIPSVQLLIAMGVPLWRIPQIRATFAGLEAKLEPEQFDMEATPQRLPDSHVVAVRITSENANNGFKPTAGHIDELMFKPTPEVWGYFSVKGGGGIHEFSDSQFGHLFAKGETREAAIRAMVVALRDVRVRGEIHTIIDYAVDMLTSPLL
ncbi:acetyl-CoA carboxylase / biotin carboxylase [Monoraphidium neglectum]|uniref:Acetyl-CoA carboxylase / biotin carboxylase n=1 Tax=Monoraphidium neglectum TaxID=145388 RepID=A0A0D2M6M5_9CHLO|nr:acetyl-CoA carboxylase / biotin carboxylase [Monoraphidium neglectum]KIY96881.1 acetyl-CoA carboxylase / biotin carboxylase [Monoraphidium neglectum]|eukprot:XP_013895901.1 acetyl-CoA carboxylase / biotin carboxylase [Monoraphidium neglectum]